MPIPQRIFFFVIGLIIVPILAYTQIGSASERTPADYIVPQGERIFYLASGVQSIDADLPLSLKELQDQEITIVYQVDQVKQLVKENGLDALIIHQSRAAELADIDLHKLYVQGVVIAGIDMTMYELATLVGDTHTLADPAWTNTMWQKPPFFSITAFKQTGTVEEQLMAQQDGVILGYTAKHTDNIVSAQSMNLFFIHLRGAIEMVKEAS
jgi:hypothetical protein